MYNISSSVVHCRSWKYRLCILEIKEICHDCMGKYALLQKKGIYIYIK